MYELFPFRRQFEIEPLPSYEAALQAVAHIQEAERTAVADCAINEHCATTLLTHGHVTEHAILLIHGFTNCPYQFQQLAPLLHDHGYTVLAMRMPRHGCADRMTGALATLQIHELLASVNHAVNIAQGLGHRVSVLGFSMGGVLAAWLAQNRSDLYRAILISPAVSLQALPIHRHWLVAQTLALLPNFFQWWNPTIKAERAKPEHAYPRFASRSLSVLLRIGLAVRSQAQQEQPATTNITIITNPSDPVIRHEEVHRLGHNWSTHGATVVEHTLPAEWNLLHDIIDPLQPEQQVDRVYPLLEEWICKALSKE